MERKMFLALLASCLVVTNSATLGPKDDGAEQPSPPASDDFLQKEIDLLEQRPFNGVSQEELSSFSPEFPREVLDLPLLIHGEPRPGFTPRSQRPSGANCGRGQACGGRQPLPRNLDEFPPGRPSPSNMGSICDEGRQKMAYGPWNLPQTGFSHLMRQGNALNDMEASLSRCCQMNEDEKLQCAQTAWEKTLTQYCKQEFSVKTKPHFCCKEKEGEDRFECFANQAPSPAYDKEIQVVSLAQVTPSLLDLLCGQVTLLSKQRHVPALIQNITEPCCTLQGDERTQCAQQEKSEFITNLCNSPKTSWKDTKKCCSQKEDAARLACFDSTYLGNVTLASAGQPLQPTEPAP